jgi:hypothetical protein
MDKRHSVHNPDLMAEAEGIVKPQYPTAVQVKNIGTSTAGLATKAEDVDRWKFIFTDIDGLSTITLDYLQGRFGKAVRVVKPWNETEIQELPRHMDLGQAVDLMRGSGYEGQFESVTLSAPEVAEEGSSYIFKMGKDLIFVNAISGKVTRGFEKT